MVLIVGRSFTELTVSETWLVVVIEPSVMVNESTVLPKALVAGVTTTCTVPVLPAAVLSGAVITIFAAALGTTLVSEEITITLVLLSIESISLTLNGIVIVTSSAVLTRFVAVVTIGASFTAMTDSANVLVTDVVLSLTTSSMRFVPDRSAVGVMIRDEPLGLTTMLVTRLFVL